MSTLHGVCTFAVDPDHHVVVTPAWCASIKSLGVQDVRVQLKADAHNHLPVDLYRQAFQTFHDTGIAVHVVLDFDFNRPWLEGSPTRVFYPNVPLGLHGNRRQNPWIVDSCVRAGDAARALGTLVSSWTIYNEGNLALDGTTRPVHIGENVPPVPGDKAPALAAEVFYSLCYELAGWLHAAGATTVQVGSLSWLPIGSAADIGWHGNAYTVGYLTTGLAYLTSTGVTQWPWQAHCCNCEGQWTLDKAMAMKRAIDTASLAHGVSMPLVIGEWGYKSPAPIDVVKAKATFDALSAVSSRMFWFQHPTTPDGWGVQHWVIGMAGFLPTTERTPWWPVVAGLVAG